MRKLTVGIGIGAIIGLLHGAASAQVEVPGGEAGAGGSGTVKKFEPRRYGVEHYSKVWSKSPFDFEIRVAEDETEEENPFENLKLAGLIQRGNEYSVSMYDEKGEKGARIQLRSGEDGNEDGFTIVRVERGKNFKETRVHVKKGNDVGIIEYDTKKIEAKATGAVGGARTGAGSRGGTRGGADGQRGNASGQQNANGQQNGNQKSAQEARNEVIKRLLEKAKQNQGGGQNANATAQGKSEPDKKRRVVLPPPK